MTYFSYHYFPSVVNVECPQCQKKAEFHGRIEFEIPLRKYLPFFKEHPHFECIKYRDSCGGNRNYATFYRGIHTRNFIKEDLPFNTENMYFASSNDPRFGSILCGYCSLKRKTQLEWLNQAYYKINYRNQVLWAYDLAHVQILYDYLHLKKRPSIRESYLLKKVPTIFLKKHARDHLCKKLAQYLKEV